MKKLLPLLLALLLLSACAPVPAPLPSPTESAPAPAEPTQPAASQTPAPAETPSPSPQVFSPKTEALLFYRSRLSPQAQGYYDEMYQAAQDFSPYQVEGGETVQADFQWALIALHYDFPETRMYTDCTLSENGAALRYVCAWTPEEAFDPEAMEAILAETEQLADALLAQVDRTEPPRTQYLQIAKCMSACMAYDHDHDYAPGSSYIYCALKYGMCICESYTDTYTYLCHRAGLWCLSLDGFANGPHAWNLVEVEGKTYHVDVTWGDQGEDYVSYFLLTEEEVTLDHGRRSLYDSKEAALAAGAKRDPSYNNDILATG